MDSVEPEAVLNQIAVSRDRSMTCCWPESIKPFKPRTHASSEKDKAKFIEAIERKMNAAAVPKKSKVLDIGCYANARTIRDHTKRKVFAENEPLRQALRYMIRNTNLPQRTRAQAQLKLAQMHAYTRSTQIKNRCTQGGRGRGIMSDFKMFRFAFRIAAMQGSLPGVKKASW